MSGKKFMRGARPTPRGKLAAAIPFRAHRAIPPSVAWVPARLSVWGNDIAGDCVTAEEAFKCAADQPENFITDAEVERWAKAHGVWNGADLLEVIQMMMGRFPQRRGRDSGRLAAVR